MATKNIVPRGNLEGGLGTSSKYWKTAFVSEVNTNNLIFNNGNLVGIANEQSAGEGVENDKVMTPLGVKNALEQQRPLNTYTSYEQLGLDNTATLLDVLNAMPKNSFFCQYIGANNYERFGVPDAGVVEIVKGQGANYANLKHQRYGGKNVERKMWIENWLNTQTTIAWKEIALVENGIVTIEKGGTGATNVETARKNLGLSYATEEQAVLGTDNAAVMTPFLTAQAIKAIAFAKNDVIPVEKGGTGVTSYEELKSEIKFNSISIASGADLNNFKTTGRYNAYLTNVSKTLLNNPLADITTGIVLEVIGGHNTANVLQILYSTLTNDVYSRRFSGSWNDWKRVGVDTSDFLPQDTIHVTEIFNDDVTWYVKYSNGWVEQGTSVAYTASANTFVPYTLPVSMADNKYSVIVTNVVASGGEVSCSVAGNTNANTTTQVYLKTNGSNRQINYRVAGWAAE